MVTTKLEVKKAVALARKYMSEVFNLNMKYVSLEEIEITKDGKYWMITLGIPTIEDNTTMMISTINLLSKKVYKIVKLNAENGKLVSIKIREV